MLGILLMTAAGASPFVYSSTWGVEGDSRGNAIALVDFDLDGETDDLLSGHDWGVSLAVQDNGDWSWSAVGHTPFDVDIVSAADVDDDGDLDVMAMSYHTIYLWLQDSNGAFTRSALTSADLDLESFIVHDVDNDGVVDVVSCKDSSADWWRNENGDGSSWTPISISTEQCREVTVGDVDGDGRDDVILAGDQAAWYSLTSKGTFVEHLVGWGNTHAIVSTDFDNDGDLDIVGVLGENEKLVKWENIDGEGTSWEAHSHQLGDLGLPRFAFCDFDGDGNLDLAAATGDEITVWSNGSWGTTFNTSMRHVHDLETGDIDLDSQPELLAIGEVGLTKYDEPMGAHDETELFVSFPAPWRVGSTDMDGDGDIDFYVSLKDDGVVRWLENRPRKQWTARVFSTEFGVIEIVPSDFDQDGDRDWIGAPGFFGDWVTFFEQRINSLVEERLGDRLSSPYSIALADVDNDGDDDVVVGAWRSLTWMQNGAEWKSHTIDDRLSLIRNTRLEVADFDDNGNIDIAAIWYDKGAWLYFHFDGQPELWDQVKLDHNAEDLALVDVDEDGLLDVVLVSKNKLKWYRNPGSADQEWVATNMGSHKSSDRAGLLVVDSDLDGHSEVLSLSDNELRFWDIASQSNEVIGYVDKESAFGLGDWDNDGV
ncbi:MAG: VCBS repeat-containing protein [Proteobacteria bacterium]|jgi:hypothetical protein|nr:VCBS repeat-containing protein [Pseudomonadota bacterium]